MVRCVRDSTVGGFRRRGSLPARTRAGAGAGAGAAEAKACQSIDGLIPANGRWSAASASMSVADADLEGEGEGEGACLYYKASRQVALAPVGRRTDSEARCKRRVPARCGSLRQEVPSGSTPTCAMRHSPCHVGPPPQLPSQHKKRRERRAAEARVMRADGIPREGELVRRERLPRMRGGGGRGEQHPRANCRSGRDAPRGGGELSVCGVGMGPWRGRGAIGGTRCFLPFNCSGPALRSNLAFADAIVSCGIPRRSFQRPSPPYLCENPQPIPWFHPGNTPPIQHLRRS